MSYQFHDIPYLKLILNTLTFGARKTDRTGTGTISTFSQQIRYDISDHTIPLLTSKKMVINAIIHELLWYIAGDTNIRYLVQNKVNIWNEWPFVAYLKSQNIEVPTQGSAEWNERMEQFKADICSDPIFAAEYGELGPVYGGQWRRWKAFDYADIDYQSDPPQAAAHFNYIDQLGRVIETLKTNPDDRRMIVNSWNVGELADMKLPPCHYAFQFYVSDGKLSCMLNQRSCDIGLGVPFNTVQYSILTHMIAQVTDLKPSEFIWNGGDCHIYTNHIDELVDQTTRTPYKSPTLKLNPNVKNLEDFTFDDFEIVGYEHHEAIRLPVAV